MRLEVGSFPVRSISFGAATRWADGHLTVEFVPALDRAAEIGDASEAGGGASIEKFLRDHATGAVPAALYERYTEESIGHLRAALGAAV